MQYVTTHEADSVRYILLQPGNHPARTGTNYQLQLDYSYLDWITESASASTILAVDFETSGGDYSADIAIVGIGLAWDTGSCYLDWTKLYGTSRIRIANLLCNHKGLIAHNVYFDGGVVRKCISPEIKFSMCTYSLLAHLSNEGHPDQSWGLKSAMTELLGWTDSNEHDLDRWLVLNGYYIGNRRIDTSIEYLNAEYESGGLRADKSKMHLAPQEILGKYCVLDAEACYLLYTEVLLPVYQKFPAMHPVFEDTMYLINLLIEQKMHGILVDRDGLIARASYLQFEMQRMETEFRNHPETRAYIEGMEHVMLQEIMKKEPAQYKKDGDVSKNWIKWSERKAAALRGELPEYRFNIQSGPQLRELLYDHMKFKARVHTESGEAAIGVKALKHMGEIGKLLIDRAYALKEFGYISKYIELTEHRSTIHPSFRTPGTMTGRLSSKEPNLQQLPKSSAVMSLFHARPGCTWVDIDFAALEAVVAAEFSRDENMLLLYGDNQPENDIHLFLASKVPGEHMADAILATGYTPVNPPPGSVAKAKKECKHQRNIAKTCVYAFQFGAGINKVNTILEENDTFLPIEQVELLHKTYWDTFSGVKDFGKALWYEWRRNQGYILNGFGRPMCVPEHMTKDLLNRFIQSTGHDILVRYIRIYTEELTRLMIPWSPLIVDFHDATTVEVPTEYAEKVVECMNWAMDQLNEFLQGNIRHRGIPVVGTDLAQVKEPEE